MSIAKAAPSVVVCLCVLVVGSHSALGGASGEVPPDVIPSSTDPASLPQLQVRVTLTAPYAESYPGAPTDRLSLQYAVKALCEQVGLQYAFATSQQNVGEKARLWVRPDIRNVPMQQALTQMLDAQGLTYTIQGTAVVLHPKVANAPGAPPAAAAGPFAAPAPGVAAVSGPVTDKEVRQAIAAVPGATAQERAHNAAVAIAQGRLVQEAARLQQEQQKVTLTQADLVKLRREGEPLQAEHDARAAAVREAEENFRKAEEKGREVNGVLYFSGWELDEVIKWRQRLQERRASYEPVRRQLEDKLTEYRRQEAEALVTQRAFAGLQQEYQVKFNLICADALPKCAAVLGVEVDKIAAQIKAQQGEKLEAAFSPGSYTWTANAKELGQVTFDPQGAFHGLDGQEGRWEMTEEGLTLTVGEWRWVFKAGPMKVLLGTGRTANIVDGAQKAVLRPVEPAPETKPKPQAPAEPLAEPAQPAPTGG